MTPDQIIVTIAGIGGIAFTYWFFLMKFEYSCGMNMCHGKIIVK